jgi:hypothetical protein
MTYNTKLIISGISVCVLIALVSYYAGTTRGLGSNKTSSSTEDVSAGTSSSLVITNSTSGTKPTKVRMSGSTAGFALYTDNNYHFVIKYPTYVKTNLIFSTFHDIGSKWRLYATPVVSGKSLLSFSIHTIDQGEFYTGKQTYPLYFTSLVRISTSANTKECYALDAGYPNQTITNVTINGIPFKKISTKESAKNLSYIQSESYRTLRNGACFVLEQIKSGTSFRDPSMKDGASDQALANYYTEGEAIIKTFRFTK